MLKPKTIKEFDNKATFVIGYRNLYNISVLFFSAVFLIFGPVTDAAISAAGIVLFVLGSKWFITQCRENLDQISIDEMKP